MKKPKREPTGIKDRDGNDVYSGDLVAWTVYPNKSFRPEDGVRTIDVVCLCEGKPVVRGIKKSGKGYTTAYVTDIEVIASPARSMEQ